jgi:hypothetical protein
MTLQAFAPGCANIELTMRDIYRCFFRPSAAWRGPSIWTRLIGRPCGTSGWCTWRWTSTRPRSTTCLLPRTCVRTEGTSSPCLLVSWIVNFSTLIYKKKKNINQR